MKKYLPAMPIMLFPYSVVFALFATFVLHSIPYLLHASLLLVALLWLASLICSIALCAGSIVKKSDAADAARLAMMAKLIPIPAYICIFLCGVICLMTIFTFFIAVVLFLLDCAAIFFSGLLGAAAVVRCKSEGVLTKGQMYLYGVLQFIFCLDIISAIIVFRKAKANITIENVIDEA